MSWKCILSHLATLSCSKHVIYMSKIIVIERVVAMHLRRVSLTLKCGLADDASAAWLVSAFPGSQRSALAGGPQPTTLQRRIFINLSIHDLHLHNPSFGNTFSVVIRDFADHTRHATLLLMHPVALAVGRGCATPAPM